MASSVYSEVTSVSTYGCERDRVLDKLEDRSRKLRALRMQIEDI